VKKAAAILFLSLLLFNFVGYRLWLYYAQARSARMLTAAVEKGDYDSTDLITLTIPLNIPYLCDWTEFRRVDGEIEFGGKIYRFVMRKVFNGQLILLCLPDEIKTQLQAAGKDFFKSVNDLSSVPAGKKQNTAHSTFKAVSADYDDQHPVWRPGLTGSPTVYALPVDQTRWPSPSYAIPGQPPETRTA
jgi:hypothetical protein